MFKTSHIPSLLLIIGLPVYWLELYVFKSNTGQTTYLATFLFMLISSVLLLRNAKSIRQSCVDYFIQFSKLTFFLKAIICAGVFLVVCNVLLAAYGAIFPVHLIQEFDVLNYHITLPKQHLLRGDFSLIKWSPAEFWPMPVAYGLTPYWLVSEFPNKIPQFIFLLGLITMVIQWTRRLSGNNFLSAHMAVFAVLGSHFIGIQMGTAMLDLTLCYLLLASVDHFLEKKWLFGVIELCFLFWAKVMLPVQFSLIGVGLIVLVCVARMIKGNQFVLGHSYVIKQWSIKKVFNVGGLFILCSALIAGPFLLRAIDNVGTPFYPFQTGLINGDSLANDNVEYWEQIELVADKHKGVKNSYGQGRDFVAFGKHFWRMAVPTKMRRVNNAFDYPVGLPILLFIVPFLFLFLKNLKERKFSLGGAFIILYWITWWVSTQQSRFLYIPIVLMFICVASTHFAKNRLLMSLLVCSVGFVSVSMVGNTKHVFKHSAYDVLRGKDKALVAMNKTYQRVDGVVVLNTPDVSYANFPVDVQVNTSQVFVIKQ